MQTAMTFQSKTSLWSRDSVGMKAARVRAQVGFTLIEMIISIAIAGTLLAIAIPNFSTFTAEMRAKNVAFELIGDLITARSEALKRNDAISITAKNSKWTDGWTVTAASSTDTIRDRNPLPSGIGIVLSDASSVIKFDSSGQLTDMTSVLKITLSSTDASAKARCIMMTPTGAARSKQGAC